MIRGTFLWLIVLIVQCVAFTEEVPAISFGESVTTRYVLQSPGASEESALRYSDPLDRYANAASYNTSSSPLAFAAVSAEGGAGYIKERCGRTDATKQQCIKELSGDPLGVLAYEQALLTDDTIKADPILYSRVGIGDAERQAYLESTYVAFNGKSFDMSPTSPKSRMRARIRELAGENRLQELDNAERPAELDDLSATKKQLDTDLDRTREFVQGKFFPDDYKQKAQEVIDKVQRADAVAKAGIRDIAAANLKLISNAEAALQISLRIAQLFGISEKDRRSFQQLINTAEKGRKTFQTLSKLGRAAAGDITAYADAGKAVMELFDTTPSFESQVMQGIGEILHNQKLIIERLDFIIAQLDRVSQRLLDIEKQVVIIDQNIRLLIEGQRELLSGTFRACIEHADTILTSDNVQSMARGRLFDPYTYPYDKKIYGVLIGAGVILRDQQNWVQSCESGIPSVFTGADVGPSTLFDLSASEQNNALGQYHASLWSFVKEFKKAYPKHPASQLDDTKLRIAASVPASNASTIDDKLITAAKKRYTFGASETDRLTTLFDRALDPYKISAVSRQLYGVLPYIWIHSGKQQNCRNNSCEGLPNWVSDIYLKSLLNSIHLNLLASSSESLIQGDILIPLIHTAITTAPDSPPNPAREDLRKQAYRLLSFNVTMRENYLRYLLYKSYVGNSKFVYRMHYLFLQDLREMEPIFGSRWKFERKAIDSQKKANEKADEVLHIIMPCMERLEAKELSSCSYPMPSPDVYVSDQLVHTSATKDLVRARYQGNRLLAVIQTYHPKNKRITNSGL